MAIETGPEALGHEESAQRLGVHPNTLYGWIQKGWLTPVSGSGREMRFRADEVEKLRRRIFDKAAWSDHAPRLARRGQLERLRQESTAKRCGGIVRGARQRLGTATR